MIVKPKANHPWKKHFDITQAQHTRDRLRARARYRENRRDPVYEEALKATNRLAQARLKLKRAEIGADASN